MGKYWKGIAPILVGLAVWAFPTPQGLEPFAWQYFSIFMAVVVALILEPIPAAAAGLMGVVLAASLLLVPLEAPKPPAKPAEAPKAAAPAPAPVPAPAGVEAARPADQAPAPKAAPAKPKPADEVKWALSGFSDGTVWLIFIAFMFALGYEKTGLGKRIALALIKVLGKRTLGLGYAVALADLVLAPFTPSNTARSGGTIFPIIKNIPALYGSTPDHEPRKIGGYLMWTALGTTCITSSLFLTGLAPNLLALSLIQKTVNVSMTWGEWFTAFVPVGAILFLTLPWLTYVFYPPTQKVSEDAPRWAGEELAKLGPLTRKEVLMACLAVFALAMWIFGGDYLNATTTALAALCLMLLFGVITWDDLLGHKQAWNVLMWFASLVTLADGLNKVGFLKWFAQSSAGLMAGASPMTVVVMFLVLFFVVHYLFASLTAHVTALLPVFLTTAAAMPGVPIKLLAVLLCSSLGLMGIITPYATGPSPIYYGSGYVSRKEFWLLGLVFGIIYLGVLVVVGVPYMKTLF